MKYTIPVIIVAAIVLAFMKDESGQSMLTKLVTSPMKKVEKGREAVEQTKDIMEKRDKQIQGYVDESQAEPEQTLSGEGYGKKVAQ